MNSPESPAERARATLRAGHFENSIVLMQAHGLLLGRIGHIDSLDHCNCDVAAQYRLHREQYETLKSSSPTFELSEQSIRSAADHGFRVFEESGT